MRILRFITIHSMKTIKFVLLILILGTFCFVIKQTNMFASGIRDVRYWGRYVYTEPKLDVSIGESPAESILREGSFITHTENNSDWLNIVDGIDRINFYNMDLDDLICELSQNRSITARLGDDFKVLNPDDFLIFSNSKRTGVEAVIKDRDRTKYELNFKRIGNKWSFLGRVHLAEGEYISEAPCEGNIQFIPRRIYKLWYKRVKKLIHRNDFECSYFFENTEKCYLNVLKDVNAKFEMEIEYKSNKAEVIDKSLIITPKQLLDSQCFPSYIDRYTTRIDRGGNFVVNIFFDGGRKEDEYLRIPLDVNEIDVDLLKNPYLGLRYKIEDPDVQTIQVVLGIDITRDKEPDIFYKQIYTYEKTRLWTEIVYPVYEKIIDEYHTQEYMHVVFIEVYPHKLWGVDCNAGKRGMYKFWIKDLYFFNFDRMRSGKVFFLDIPVINDVDFDTWNSEILYGIPTVEVENNEMETFKKTEINLYKDIPDIDLREYPLLEFDFEVKKVSKALRVSAVASLDFDNDGIADGDLIINEDKIMFPPVNILEMAEKLFPERDFYNLVKFNIIFAFEEFPTYMGAYLNRFRLFRKSRIRVKDMLNGNSIFCLNDERLKARSYFKNRVDKKLWLGAEAGLKKGRYLITDISCREIFKSSGFRIDFNRDGHTKRANSKVVGLKRLNPTLYKVTIKTENEPFWLIFNEYFHPGWKAYVVQNKDNENIDKYLNWSTTLYTLAMRGNINEEKKHFFVNNCANGWWIKSLGKEELVDILLVYAPQKGYEIALLTTGISMVGCLLGIRKLKRYICQE